MKINDLSASRLLQGFPRVYACRNDMKQRVVVGYDVQAMQLEDARTGHFYWWEFKCHEDSIRGISSVRPYAIGIHVEVAGLVKPACTQ